ncbi:hypothetical protein [Parasitella parasitica]|uniref:SP-RING-type domain-containing protein n=1 Tax=Parasitella parasitica TaxID=35722 RepID=A0A0B7MW68_9FUNG|nr:hypothetical protein [Parasitella parasitica]
MISNSNHNVQPLLSNELLTSSLSENDRLIYERNNIRLSQMEAEVRQLETYGGACDELLDWLSDQRAYNPYNEKALLGCISAISEKATEYGAWSGMEILKEANLNCAAGLSERGRAYIRKCFEDLQNSVNGRRPSNTSTMSSTSVSHPSPSSLVSNKSVQQSSTVPESPTAATSNYSQMVKLFDTSLFPQSPNSNTGSPLASPQFAGAEVAAASPRATSSTFPLSTDTQLNNFYQRQIEQRAAQIKQNELGLLKQQQYIQPYQQQYQQQQPQINIQRLSPAQLQHIKNMQLQHEQNRRAQQEEQRKLLRQQEIRKQRELYEMQRRLEAQRLQETQRQEAQRQEAQRQEAQRQEQLKQRQIQLQTQFQLQQQQQQQQQLRQYQQHLGKPPQPPASNNVPPSVAMPTTVTTGQYQASGQHQDPRMNSYWLVNDVAMNIPSDATTANAATTTTANTPAGLSFITPTASAVTPVSLTAIPENAVVNPASVIATPSVTETPSTSNGMSKSSFSVPTTPNIPLKIIPRSASISVYPSATRSSTDTLKIQLPGGGALHKSSGPGDKIEYQFKIRHAFPPFRLAHGEVITKKPFFIPDDEFDKLFKNPNTTFTDYHGQVPLSYMITAWYDNTPERKCDWPTGARIELNGHNLPLQKREKINNPNGPSTISGKDKPFDLTRLLTRGTNTLVLHQPRCACSYSFAVQVFMRPSQNFILGLVQNNTISVDKCNRLIDNLLGKFKNQDDDEDLVIVQKSVTLKMKCPLTFKRMSQPVRGVNCKHIDCFDLDAYLMVNKVENPTWACPHCNNITGPTSLARDLLVEQFLTTLPKRASEIEFVGNHTNFKTVRLEDPDSDDEDDPDNKDNVFENMADMNGNSHQHVVATCTKKENVIDLISDDEEGELRPDVRTSLKRSWDSQNH